MLLLKKHPRWTDHKTYWCLPVYYKSLFGWFIWWYSRLWVPRNVCTWSLQLSKLYYLRSYKRKLIPIAVWSVDKTVLSVQITRILLSSAATNVRNGLPFMLLCRIHFCGSYLRQSTIRLSDSTEHPSSPQILYSCHNARGSCWVPLQKFCSKIHFCHVFVKLMNP